MRRWMGLALVVLAGWGWGETVPGGAPPGARHLTYFGFALVDAGWDDPSDGSPQTNYLDEVSDFTNIGDLLVTEPGQDLSPRLERFARKNVGVLLHVWPLLFESRDSGAPGGWKMALRNDFRLRWASFLASNPRARDPNLVKAWYLGEEPTWNGVSSDELEEASSVLKASAPQIPLLVIEAAPALGEFRVPPAVDWVGFDQYFLRDPLEDPGYQQRLSLLKSLRSRPGQKLVLVLDSHWSAAGHGKTGLTEDDLGLVALRTYQLAEREPDVVALIGYVWPGGFGAPETKGARNLPPAVRNLYRYIGRAVIH